MSALRIRVLLWSFSFSMICAGSWIAVAAFRFQVVPPLENTFERQQPIPKSVPPTNASWTLNEKEFGYVWWKPLHRPLVDPAPLKPVAELPSEPVVEVRAIRLDAELIATLADPDPAFAIAWIQYRNQTQKLKRDEVIEGHPGEPKIVAIRDSQVDVILQERLHTLSLIKSDLWAMLPSAPDR